MGLRIGPLIGLLNVLMEPRSSTPTTTNSVTLRLRKEIGRLAEGDRLPSERMLSTELCCSRSTIRAALLGLEEAGLIWRHVGQGTFVGARPAAEPVRSPALFEQTSPAELMAARRIIEPAVAAAAACHATPVDIARLRALARATPQAADWRAYEAADEAFHRAIAAATGSRLIIAIVRLLSSVRARTRWRRQHGRAFRAAQQREYSRAQGALHMVLVESLEDGDAHRAAAIMADHMEQIARLRVEERPVRIDF